MRVKQLLLVALLLFVFSSIVWPADFSAPRMLRLSLLEGDVTYQRSDLERWVDLSINTPVLEGDKIWVGKDGRAELEFENGNFARLSANTIVEVVRLDSATGNQIRVNQGLVTFDLKSVLGLVAITPRFSAQAKEAASFRLDVDSDGSGRLVMFEGQAEVSGQNAKLYVRKGETVRFLDQDERYYLETSYVKDDWDRWNEERQAYLDRVTEDRLHYGDRGWTTADLHNYGTWYNDSTYGRIWRPSVAFDWVPFRNGRWVWYSNMGWSWVSYEPWGWIPYHYGRWSYLNLYGWSWVPGARFAPWCPGAVNWVQGPHWVGWVPLAPYEPWYPYGYSGVNVFVSKNFGHRAGVTYWHRDHFVNGTPVRDFRFPRNPYSDGRIIAGQPRVTPTPASRMPVVGTAPARTFTNADLEARRNMRERILNAGSTPNLGSPSEFDRLRQQRSRVSSGSSFDTNQQNVNSGIRTSPGVSNLDGSGSGPQTYDNWGSRSSIRSQQRQRLYQTDGSRMDSTYSGASRSDRSTWARPSNPAYAPPTSSTRDGSGDRYDSRQRLYETYRERNSRAGVSDRYAPRSIQREFPGGRMSPYTPPSLPRPMIPQGPTPSYTSPRVQPTGPPPSYQGPISSRSSVHQSQSSNSGAASTHEGRGAVRGRMGR